MKELIRLVERCKGEVIITSNPNRSSYQTADDYLKFRCQSSGEDWSEYLNGEVGLLLYEGIKVSENWYEIQFYPDTPIGFFTVYHFDLEQAVKQCHEILDK